MVSIVRCQYAIKGGETLTHVAAYYRTNWIQVCGKIALKPLTHSLAVTIAVTFSVALASEGSFRGPTL